MPILHNFSLILCVGLDLSVLCDSDQNYLNDPTKKNQNHNALTLIEQTTIRSSPSLGISQVSVYLLEYIQ